MTCCDALTMGRPTPTMSRRPPLPPGNPGGQDGRGLPGTGGSQPARVPERQPGREPEHPKHRFPAMTGDDPQTGEQDSGKPLAKVIPLGIFDPFEEAKKPW
jgi:hypothetical protein